MIVSFPVPNIFWPHGQGCGNLLEMAAAKWGFHVCIFLFVSQLNGQIPKKEKYYAIKDDLPYIKCETCQKAVRHLYLKTHEMRDGGTKKVRLKTLCRYNTQRYCCAVRMNAIMYYLKNNNT